MLQKASENVLAVLKNMEEFERMVGGLYWACRQIWPVEKEFWTDMAQAEMRHAENMNRMREMISKRPESFSLDRHFKSAAIKTAISGIQWQMDRLKKNEMTEEKMLYIARDLEQTILENHYNNIVKTSDSDFKSLMDEIVSDTVAHHDQLNRKINPLTTSRS